jgi:hypothetical protein
MKARLYAGLAIVLLSGLAIGFVAGQHFTHWQIHRLMRRGPEPLERMLTDRLSRKLILSPEQVIEVRKKIVVVVQEMDAARRSEGEAIQARMMRLLQDIRPILNGDQQKTADTMRAEDLRPDPPPGLPHGPPPWALPSATNRPSSANY